MSSCPPGLRVLVVDDEAQILELLSLTLSLRGYVVTTAHSGPDALAQAQGGRFDVIVMDVLMAPWDGFETVWELARAPGGLDTPVVFLSGLVRPDPWPALPGGLRTEYLLKPFRPADLVGVIERVCEPS